MAAPASGRILSGGVDSAALYPPKRFLGAARNIENGGSLTILASALIDTGSKMDEVIFEEFKGTGNMELKLDRDLADRRIFPAIDPVASGTRNEDLLVDEQMRPFVFGLRRILAGMNNTERAAASFIKGLKGTNTNQEFLVRSAKSIATTSRRSKSSTARGVIAGAMKGRGLRLGPFYIATRRQLSTIRLASSRFPVSIRHRRLQSTGRFRIIAFKLRDGKRR